MIANLAATGPGSFYDSEESFLTELLSTLDAAIGSAGLTLSRAFTPSFRYAMRKACRVAASIWPVTGK
jgi:hypothetical protein